MHDISFDLETLSTRPDAAIVAIGAVVFDRVTGYTGAEYHRVIDLDDAITHGHVSGSTVKWWAYQSEAARAVFDTPAAEVFPLGLALVELSRFVMKQDGDPDSGSVRVWGNGSHFDISILENAYRATGIECPWKFWDVRDMRTIVDVATAYGFDKRQFEFEGTAHNALHDARHQARLIAAAFSQFTFLR